MIKAACVNPRCFFTVTFSQAYEYSTSLKYFTFMHASIPNECKPMMFDRGSSEQEYFLAA